jgi:hypothetical protein
VSSFIQTAKITVSVEKVSAGGYHKNSPYADTSDGITIFQQPKIIADLFSVSQPYLGRSILSNPD